MYFTNMLQSMVSPSQGTQLSTTSQPFSIAGSQPDLTQQNPWLSYLLAPASQMADLINGSGLVSSKSTGALESWLNNPSSSSTSFDQSVPGTQAIMSNLIGNSTNNIFQGN
jgi:hypothetical protein